MSNYRVIIKNFASNGAGFFVEALIAFLMLPYVIHKVGDATYGLWAIVLSLSGYMGILNLGLRPAINKYVAEYNARNEQNKIFELVKAGIFIYSFCAILIIILSLTVAWNLERLFSLPAGSVEDCRLIVVFTGIQMSLGLIAVVYGGVISGLQRYDINNGIEIFVMITRTILILIALNYYQNIYALAVPHLVMTITGYLLTYYFARKLITFDRKTRLFKIPDKETFKVLVKFSSITFTINIVGSLLAYLDNILVASIISTTFVTYYVIGSRLVSYTKKMIDSFVSVLSPAASVYYATNETYHLQSLFIYSIKMCKLISFPCLIFFLISGRDFLHFWIGQDTIDSYNVLIVLSIAAFFTLSQRSAGPILYGINKHKIVLYVSVIEGILTVLLAYFLGHKYKLMGVAIGLSAPSIVMGAVIYPFYLAKIINLDNKTVFKVLYLENSLLFIGFASLLYAVNKLLSPGNIYMILTQFVICLLIYVCYVWKFVLNEEQRYKLKALLPQRVAKCFVYSK